jgi:hypothetical protein
MASLRREAAADNALLRWAQRLRMNAVRIFGLWRFARPAPTPCVELRRRDDAGVRR